jgi:hypothetical protein
LQIAFPQWREEQERLIEGIQQARQVQRTAVDTLRHELNQLSDLIDGRGDEDLPGIPDDDSKEEQPSAG